MDDLLLKLAVFAGVGLACGFIGGLLGIGGSMIRIPIFVHLLPGFGVASGVLMHVSLSTSLALIVPSSLMATYKQHRLGNLDMGYYRTWALGVLLGLLVGLPLLPQVPSRLLKVFFLIFILLILVYMARFDERVKLASQPPQGLPKLAIAAIIGCVAILTGTGGGITSPIMKAFNMPLKKAIALSSATGIVASGVGTFGVILSGWNAQGLPPYSLGFVDPVIWLVMLPTTLLAVPVGVKVSNRLRKVWLHRAYLTYLAATAMVVAVAVWRG